jgi:hypothetical protein
MDLNTAITNNDFDYVRNNRGVLAWDITKPVHVSTIEMCDLLIKLGYDNSRVLSCVTTVELFDYLVHKQYIYIIHYVIWLLINNHTNVILRWIEQFPELLINRDQVSYHTMRLWLNCDRCVIIARNNLNQQIQFTLQIAIIDNTTLINNLHVKKLDYEMYKSFHELCNV